MFLQIGIGCRVMVFMDMTVAAKSDLTSQLPFLNARWRNFSIIKYETSIQRGHQGCRTPPGAKFFHIHAGFGNKIAK